VDLSMLADTAMPFHGARSDTTTKSAATADNVGLPFAKAKAPEPPPPSGARSAGSAAPAPNSTPASLAQPVLPAPRQAVTGAVPVMSEPPAVTDVPDNPLAGTVVVSAEEMVRRGSEGADTPFALAEVGDSRVGGGSAIPGAPWARASAAPSAVVDDDLGEITAGVGEDVTSAARAKIEQHEAAQRQALADDAGAVEREAQAEADKAQAAVEARAAAEAQAVAEAQAEAKAKAEAAAKAEAERLEAEAAAKKAEQRRLDEAERFKREQEAAQKLAAERAAEDKAKKLKHATELRSKMYGGFKRKK